MSTGVPERNISSSGSSGLARSQLSDFKDVTKREFLSCSNEDVVNYYILSSLREITKSGSSTVLEVSSKSSAERAIEVMTVYPMDSDRWVIQVNVGRARGNLKKIADAFKGTDTSVLWYKCTTYPEYKSAKEVVTGAAVDRYLSYLSRSEVNFLLADLVNQEIVDYVYKNYSGVPDAVIRLYNGIVSGDVEVTKSADVLEYLGVQLANLRSAVYTLLEYSDYPKRVMGEAVKGSGVGKKQQDIFKSFTLLASKVGCHKLHRQLLTIVSDLETIKGLYLAGKIYDHITQSACNRYPSLSKYRRDFWRIKDYDLIRIQALRLELASDSEWFNELDVIAFLERWMGRLSLRAAVV